VHTPAHGRCGTVGRYCRAAPHVPLVPGCRQSTAGVAACSPLSSLAAPSASWCGVSQSLLAIPLACRFSRTTGQARSSGAAQPHAQPHQRTAPGQLGARARHWWVESGLASVSVCVWFVCVCVWGGSRQQLLAWGPALHAFCNSVRCAPCGPAPAAVHVVIGLSWYCGATPQQLRGIYDRLYTDVYR
jgi:hypothetical protein